MADLQKSLVEAYLAFVCEMVGINEIEGYRRYQTDVMFKNGIDAMAHVALVVITEHHGGDSELINMDLFHERDADPDEKEPLWAAFQRGLLGT